MDFSHVMEGIEPLDVSCTGQLIIPVYGADGPTGYVAFLGYKSADYVHSFQFEVTTVNRNAFRRAAMIAASKFKEHLIYPA